MSYLMPETVPTELRCIKVYIPDCPEAVLAVKGSLFYLCRWLAWHGSTNADNREVDMAKAMLMAYGQSFNDCDECVDMSEITDLITAVNGLIQELSNMQIIQNNCGCGCGCGSGGSGGNETDYPPGDGVPTPGGNQTDDNSWLCRASYDVVERHKQFWQQVRFYSQLPAGTARSILNGLEVFFDTGAEFSTLMGVIGQWLSSGLASLCIEALEAMGSSLVSLIRTSANSSEARTRVLNAIWSSSYPVYVRTALWCVFALAQWDMVFEPDSWNAPARPECENVNPDGCISPSGYQLFSPDVVEEIEASTSNTVISSAFDTNIETECGSHGLIACVGMLDEQNENLDPKWRVYTENGDAIGFLFEVLENVANGGNDPSELPVIRLHLDNDMADETAEQGFVANAPFSVAVVLSGHETAFASPVCDNVIVLPGTVGSNVANKDFIGQLYRRSGVSNNRFGSCQIAIRVSVIVPV